MAGDATRRRDRQTHHLRVRAIVNATGPWVGEVLQNRLKRSNKPPLRLVKGSHIITRRATDHDRAYILQHDDGRIVFAIPMKPISPSSAPPMSISTAIQARPLSAPRKPVLCAAINRFRDTDHPKDVVATFAECARFDDGAIAAHQATRDFVLELDDGTDSPPLLNIYGGKITTYRAWPGRPWPSWPPLSHHGTGLDTGLVLPAGTFQRPASVIWSPPSAPSAGLAATPIRRLARAYGTRAQLISDGVETVADLGRHLAPTMPVSWITCALNGPAPAMTPFGAVQLGLRLTATEQTAVRHWFEALKPKILASRENDPWPAISSRLTGTTSTRALVFNDTAEIMASAQQEFRNFPSPDGSSTT